MNWSDYIGLGVLALVFVAIYWELKVRGLW